MWFFNHYQKYNPLLSTYIWVGNIELYLIYLTRFILSLIINSIYNSIYNQWYYLLVIALRYQIVIPILSFDLWITN